MSLLIIHIVSIIIDLSSIGVLIFTIKKAKHIIHTNKELVFLGKDLMRQIAISSANLDKAVLILKEEHEDLCDENRRMDARVIESTRVRKEITKLMDEIEAGHTKLKDSYHRLQKLNTEIESRLTSLNNMSKHSNNVVGTVETAGLSSKNSGEKPPLSSRSYPQLRNQTNSLLQAINGGLPFLPKKIDETSEKEII